MNLERFEKLMNGYFDGNLPPSEREELSTLLETDAEARDAFWRLAHTHASLRAWGLEQAGLRQIAGTLAPSGDTPITPEAIPAPPGIVLDGWGASGWGFMQCSRSFSSSSVLACGCGSGTSAAESSPSPPTIVSTANPPLSLRDEKGASVARLESCANCTWIDPAAAPAEGDNLSIGQKLELSSGRAKIVFDCGAEVTLWGPAIFQIKSAKNGFMPLGQLSVRAATPAARGFTVASRSAVAEDLGTEFGMMASPDGHSRISVTSGQVEVQSGSATFQTPPSAGQSIEVEPNSRSITARIESGNDTAAFKFPTIDPPSARDYADASQHHATIRVARGKPHPDSGPVGVLLDGRGQSRSDSPGESFYFDENTSGLILLDLGRAIDVSRVNTYSWHKGDVDNRDRTRAVQKYYLYGARGPQPPSTEGDPVANGWTLIARVNTDEFFGLPHDVARPAQQGVSIAAEQGPIGKYQFLLWDVRPSPADKLPVNDNAFFGEFDVYGE